MITKKLVRDLMDAYRAAMAALEFERRENYVVNLNEMDRLAKRLKRAELTYKYAKSVLQEANQ
jgi:hypothetical protein